MKETVLITGCTSGIGLELTLLFAARNYDLVLVARDPQKLKIVEDTIKEDFINCKVFSIVQDLINPQAAMLIMDQLISNHLQIDILVNNAGFGDYGEFAKCDWHRQANMIQVNITSMLQLTRYILPLMITRDKGKILNLASTASFQPGPYMSVYYATKSFILSFSEALSAELKDTNISVTALCPGPTNSNFAKTAGQGTIDFFSKMKQATPHQIAKFAYDSLMSEKTVAIHGFNNSSLVQLQRLLPRRIILYLLTELQKPENKTANLKEKSHLQFYTIDAA